MSFSCGLECVVIIGCTRWAWKRCTYVGSDDSATWALATPDEFESVPRICRLILAGYESDLRNPQFPPSGGYRLNPDWVVKRVTYEQTSGHAPPYLIYCDHDHNQIVLCIRGLNLIKESDYKTLLDNRLGMQMFDGGYVHHGLLKSAIWLLNEESETLKSLWVENGSRYEMVFAGHSLGSGVAALLAVIVVNHRDRLGGIPRDKVRCYAVAPARCMSLNLAVKYADVIHSIVLQLAVLVIFGLLEGYLCTRRCGRFPPEVRTAIPVDGRFEHIVLSCNATSDHGIVWIERESEKALQRMKESSSETVTAAPRVQKIERLQTIEKEHKDALERAVSLNVPHAVTNPEEVPSQENEPEPSESQNEDDSKTKSQSNSGRTNWDEVVEKLFKKDESGELLLMRDTNAPQLQQ
uniref:Fungal lipase-like domain-containing protein n=1 Tax=Fagus sylvatica TaxID=28930 RepID=A0A2N9ETH4_FAGSY